MWRRTIVPMVVVAATVGCTPELTGRPVGGAPATTPYVATVPSAAPTLAVEQVPFKQPRVGAENVDPFAASERQALGPARPAFASYFITMHNKIHPLFADRGLDELDKAQSKELDDPGLFAVVEMVLRANDGAIARRGVVKPSGVTAFDMIALKTVDLAAPFGKAPDIIVSYDGLVYVRWEFHRSRVDACSTRGAWPMIRRPPSAPLP